MTYYIQIEHNDRYVGMFTIRPNPFTPFMQQTQQEINRRWPTLRDKKGLFIDICTQLPKPVYR